MAKSRGRPVAVLCRLALVAVLAGCVPEGLVEVGEPTAQVAATAAITTTTTVVPQLSLKVVDPRGRPLPDVEVGFDGTAPAITGDDGLVNMAWPGEPVEVSLAGAGFEPTSTRLTEPTIRPVEIALTPVVLRGTVTAADGAGIAGARVVLGAGSDISGENGEFTIGPAAPGELIVSKPAWEPVTLNWGGRRRRIQLQLQPRLVRGLHIGGWIPADTGRWVELLRLADETEVNALVVDVKDESGKIFHPSRVPLARRVDATRTDYDLDELAAQVHERGLYLIGRVTTFQDPVAARAIPGIAVFDTSTGEPFTKNGQWFLDPTDPRARQYGLDVAVEACRGGFDEIQFDYVRFPDGYSDAVRFDGRADELGRVSTISGFLEEARALLHPLGCAVAADIFGFIISIEDDGGIGQKLEHLAAHVDVVSPMVYPSHYGTGWFGAECPNDHPAAVVGGALDQGLPRLPGDAIMRPWIQDFDWAPCGPAEYGAAEVRAQIDAAVQRGLGYMVWNAASVFTTGAFRPEG